MIITDPTKRPSERLIEIVKDYFIAKGFVYKKSLNQFARLDDHRKDMVSIFYNRTVNLVSATFTWANLFVDLEKIYAAIEDDKTKRSTTLWTDQLNYLPNRYNKSPSDFALYDKDNFNYTDESINFAADQLKITFETTVQPFLEYYKDLKNLEKELNQLPLSHHPYVGYGGRQIAFGLILGKLFKSEDFDSLIGSYKQYILRDEYGIEFQRKMEHYLKRTVSYLDSIDIFKVIPQ